MEHSLAIKRNELLPLHGVTFHDMDEPQKHDAKWKKPGTRDRILYHSINMQCLEKANLETESLYSRPGLE